MYGNDMHKYLIKNQTREDPVENHKEPQSPTFMLSLDNPDDDGLLALHSILQAETEKQETFEKERQRTLERDRQPTFEEKLKMFNIDETRIEHLRKMNEVKSLMPDKEQNYYNSVRWSDVRLFVYSLLNFLFLFLFFIFFITLIIYFF